MHFKYKSKNIVIIIDPLLFLVVMLVHYLNPHQENIQRCDRLENQVL